MISVRGLIKAFGPFHAVDGISFDVPKGQVLGFLGPNGAGKSTTMKMLTCFLEPTSGTALIGDKDIRRESVAVRRQLGYLPESAPSYGEMTVREFLHFIAEVRGYSGREQESRKDRVRDLCALSEVWRQPIETLSKGYRQRVGFAQALIHDPKVLILDEPTDGLDPNQKHHVRQLIKGMAREKTIILSTHILEEVEAVCDRAVIIARGRVVADATPQELLRRSSTYNAVTLQVASQILDRTTRILARETQVDRVEVLSPQDGLLRVYPKGGAAIALPISELCGREQIRVERLTIEPGRLDEVFRLVTTTASKEGATVPAPADPRQNLTQNVA
jgi:ABC-2 type transport system ATP-binding protein